MKCKLKAISYLRSQTIAIQIKCTKKSQKVALIVIPFSEEILKYLIEKNCCKPLNNILISIL